MGRMNDAAGASVAELWAALPLADRTILLKRFGEDVVARAVAGCGALRGAQLPPPGEWSIWAVLAGRGFGKTRAGAEWILGLAEGAKRRFALVGAPIPGALHLGVLVPDGVVHAHAGLGRVVEGPVDPDWTIRGVWRWPGLG